MTTIPNPNQADLLPKAPATEVAVVPTDPFDADELFKEVYERENSVSLDFKDGRAFKGYRQMADGTWRQETHTLRHWLAKHDTLTTNIPRGQRCDGLKELLAAIYRHAYRRGYNGGWSDGKADTAKAFRELLGL